MSARITRSVATVAASALIGSAALAFPAAANAATPASAPMPALRLSVTSTAPGSWLQPGGAARTEVVKVTNTTGKAQKFVGMIGGFAKGAVFLRAGELKFSVTALGRTPATATVFAAQVPGYMGAFYPTAHKYGAFTIPAHATFAWKLSVAATKAWPLNDSGLAFAVGVGQEGVAGSFVAKEVDFTLAKGTGGPVVEKLFGDTSLSVGHPAFVGLTVTNRTGAALKQDWRMQPWIDQAAGTRLAVDVWVGSAAKGHWQPLTQDLNAAGLANGASKTFELRVRVVDYTAKSPVRDQLEIMNWDGSVASAPHQELLVH